RWTLPAVPPRPGCPARGPDPAHRAALCRRRRSPRPRMAPARPYRRAALRAGQARGRRAIRRCTRFRRYRCPWWRIGCRPALFGPIHVARTVGRGRLRRRRRARRPVRALPRGSAMTADHHHPAELAPVEARVAAIESVLVEKGIIDTDALDV